MTAQLLRERGYQVIAVSSAEDALAVAADELARVRLVITDETLPGRAGSELAHVLHQRFGVPALVVSGFIAAETAQTLARRGVRVLAKPHRDDELAQAIREILDRKN
jgi:CheY-like chemotaxis protein